MSVSVAHAYRVQQHQMLLQAIADWRVSSGAAHVRDRRFAMALLAIERSRRALRRAELRAATIHKFRRIAA